MHIDMYTLMVQGGFSALLLGLVFLFYWSRDPKSAWLRWWSLPCFSVAVASFIYTHWTDEPNLVPIILGNLALQFTSAAVWTAARAFERRRPMIWPLLASWGIWLALCTWEPFIESLPMRVIAASILMPAFFFLAGYELWRGRAERLTSRMPAIIAVNLAGIIFMMRIPFVNVLPFPFGALPLVPMAQSLMTLFLFGFAMLMTILMISMTRERSEYEQRQFAMTDPLTGLLNRRAFTGNAQRVLRRHFIGRRPLSVLMLDLDHFKAINDRYGHDAGDRVLIRFADVLERNVRPTDQVYRIGGEEFCCILPGATGDEAMRVAERICTDLQAVQIEVPGGVARATVSIGAACTSEAGYDFDDLLGLADAAVYEAKAGGRNRAVLAGAQSEGTRPARSALRARRG